jgi:hypothetical protein
MASARISDWKITRVSDLSSRQTVKRDRLCSAVARHDQVFTIEIEQVSRERLVDRSHNGVPTMLPIQMSKVEALPDQARI